MNKKSHTTSSTNYKWAVAIISAIIATVFWFLVQLNTRSFTTSVTYPVKLSNVPKQLQLRAPFPETLEMTIEGLGINLFYEFTNLKEDTIRIDYRTLSQEKIIDFTRRNMQRNLRAVLPNGVNILDVEPGRASLETVPLAYKKVPLKAIVKFAFAPTYRLIEKPVYEPDSILVIGPEDKLQAIHDWHTLEFNSTLISGDATIEIPLAKKPPFVTEPAKVSATIKTAPFTEKQLSCPITPINFPDSLEVQISPSEVKLNFLIPVKEYEKATIQDFLIALDYNQLDRENRIGFIRCIQKPELAKINRMSPQQVTFTLTKRP